MSEERDLLAAEYALHLLDAAELDEARRRAASDHDFAAEVARWEERLQPLVEELPAARPDPRVWAAIEQAVAAAPKTAANDNQTQYERRLRRWQIFGVGMTALAASFAAVVVTGLLRTDGETGAPAPGAIVSNTVPAAPGELLVASLAGQAAPNAASITYHVPSSSLLVTPVRWPEDPAHDHVLWVIPPGGEPVKVGPCCQSGPERHNIPKELAPHFRARSSLAVSVEPRGGAPAARPSSPFVVRSELNPV